MVGKKTKDKDGTVSTWYVISTPMAGDFTTFNQKLAQAADDASANGELVELSYKVNGKYQNLVGLRAVGDMVDAPNA